MSSSYYVRDNCRMCLSSKLETVLHLTPTPPANELKTSDELNTPVQEFPLYLVSCSECHHVQLPVVVPSERLFSNYVYVSGTSASFVSHFYDYAKCIQEDWDVRPGSSILEIGSNDGTMLKALQELGMKVLGVDPAVKIARTATSLGYETIPEFFSETLAEEIIKQRGHFDVVIANNVFAHADDIRTLAKNILNSLKDDGLFFFEVSYLPDVIQNTLFDTIYHEHVSYHHVAPLDLMFESFGATLVHVMRVNTHGGSIRCVVRKGRHDSQASVSKHVHDETLLGLNNSRDKYFFDPFKSLENRINSLRTQLKDFIYEARSSGRTICGYGAPAKATTLLHHFGINSSDISYIIDDSPWKQRLFIPGKNIPIHPRGHMFRSVCDDVIILAWNFADGIINSLADSPIKRAIVPVPEFRVIRLRE